MSEASLILSTFNQPDALASVLAAISRQQTLPQQVIIADDGSDSDTADRIAIWADQAPIPVVHIWQPNDGFRKTLILNEAIAHASARYILLLDGDCVPHPKFVADHLALAEPGCFVQGRRAFIAETAVPAYTAGSSSLPRLLLRGQVSGLSKAFRLPLPLIRKDQGQRGLIGCNLAIWKSDLVAINGFDENFIGWGGEDSDLGSRLYHLGRTRKFVYGRAIVYHLNHPKLSRDRFSTNLDQLQQTLATRRIRCDNGLDRHPSTAFKIRKWRPA